MHLTADPLTRVLNIYGMCKKKNAVYLLHIEYGETISYGI